jgi:hypothetical protein
MLLKEHYDAPCFPIPIPPFAVSGATCATYMELLEWIFDFPQCVGCGLLCRNEIVKAYEKVPNVTNMQFVVQSQMLYYELERKVKKNEGLPLGFSPARAFLPQTDLPEFLQRTLVRHSKTQPG